MKKMIVVLVVALMVLPVASSASMGVIAGLSHSWIDQPGSGQKFETGLGFSAGVLMSLDLPVVSFELDALYSQKNVAAVDEKNADYKYTYKFSYIELPVLLKLSVPAAPVPTLLVGLVPAINIGMTGQQIISGTAGEVYDYKLPTKLMWGYTVGLQQGISAGVAEVFLRFMFEFIYHEFVSNGNEYNVHIPSLNLSAGVKF